MGYKNLDLLLTFGLSVVINGLKFVYGNSTNSHPDCKNECLRCTSFGCVKCRNFINLQTRECLTECPYGYTEQWSTVPDIMGRTCQRGNYFSSIIAIIVGSICGLIFCLVLIILVFYLLKRRNRKKMMQNRFMDTTIKHDDFLRQLDGFRSNADNFLGMLNDVRRQIRKLHTSGDVCGAMSYHPVVRDLAKLLILLNKPNEIIPGPPHDWNRLAAWAEYILEHHKPQMEPLIDFYQAPNISSQDPRLSYCQHSTFKSNITRTTAATTSDSSNEQQNNLFGSLISLHEFDQPRPSNIFGSSTNIKYLYQSPEVNGSSLWLEDEFFKLGFRPQDEITTEL